MNAARLALARRHERFEICVQLPIAFAAMRAAHVLGVALRRQSIQLVKLKDDGRLCSLALCPLISLNSGGLTSLLSALPPRLCALSLSALSTLSVSMCM
jgi:hypothetical protein